MGVAAYNRGSQAIREQFDREAQERLAMAPREAADNECQRCFGKLSLRLDRGCTWSVKLRKWVDACSTCRRIIENENMGR